MSEIIGIVVGLVLGAGSAVIAGYFPRDRALDLCAIFLPAIASVYAGSSLAAAPSTAVLEITVTFLFFGLAVFARWSVPVLLVIGYGAHGVWDALHYAGLLATALPSWYGPFCAAYDVLIAAFIALVLLRRPLESPRPA